MQILASKKLRNISPSDVVWTGCGGVMVWTSGPVVEFFLEEIFIYRDFIFKFSWTSGNFFLGEIYIS